MWLQVFLQSCIDINTPVENWACMGTGVFSEHRGRTGKVPGRDAVPPDSLCKKQEGKEGGWEDSTEPGARAGDTAQWQSPGLAHRGPDFHSQAHKEVKKPRNSEYHLDSSKVHEKPWKLELEARLSCLEIEHLCVLGTWSLRAVFRL